MRDYYKKVMIELDGFYQITIGGKLPLGFSTKCRRRVSESIINKIAKYI